MGNGGEEKGKSSCNRSLGRLAKLGRKWREHGRGDKA